MLLKVPKISSRFIKFFLFNIFYLLLRHLTSSENGIIAISTSNPIIPPVFRIGFEILTLTFLLAVLTRKIKSLKADFKWILLTALFFIPLLASTFISITAPYFISYIQILSSIRSWILWLTPLFFGIFVFKINDIPILQKIVVVIAFMQVPLAFFQSMAIIKSADDISGLMGAYGSGVLAIFQVIATSTLFINFLNKKLSFFVLVICTIILISPSILARAMIVFIILPVSWIIALLSIKNKKRILSVLPFVIIILVSLTILFSQIYTIYVRSAESNPIERVVTDIYNVIIPDSKTQNVTRSMYFLYVVDELSKSPLNLVLGYGTGFSSTSRLINFSRVLLMPNSIGNGSLIVSILLENGVIGAIYIFAFLFSIYYFLIRIKKKMKSEFELSIINNGLVMIILLSLLVFYNQSFTSSGLVWLILPQFGLFIQWFYKISNNVAHQNHEK